MGAAIDRFVGKFNEFRALRPGEKFSVRVTDFEANEAAREYLSENRAQVTQLIRNAAGVGLEVSDPEIRFHTDELALSARGGRGLMKVRASLCAEVRWENRLVVNVKSVEVPFIQVTPQKLNSIVEQPLRSVMNRVSEYAEIRAFRLIEGAAILEGLVIGH